MTNPKITMTLLVRDEQDIIAENIRFHHNRGVDSFIVMDNLSTDLTAQIVKNLSKDIEIEYIFQPGTDYNQWEWVTQMARRACLDHKADWVINNDADEFWVPQGGDLKSVLRPTSSLTSSLYVERFNAVVMKDDIGAVAPSGHPATTNLFSRVSLNPAGDPLPGKVMHRAWPSAMVAQGNHSVLSLPGGQEAAGERVKILHFPYRGLDRYKRKVRQGGEAYARNRVLNAQIGITWRNHYSTLDGGGVDQFWSDLTKSPESVQNALRNGDLFHMDTVTSYLAEEPQASIQKAFDELLAKTRPMVETFCEEQANFLVHKGRAAQLRHPHTYNFEFSQNGARAHVKQLEEVSTDVDNLPATFAQLRDIFSLFPRNPHFKPFLTTMLETLHPLEAAQLRKDCQGKRVILHTSCHPRLAKTHETIASFANFSPDDVHHIILLGAPEEVSEGQTKLAFSYDGQYLQVPSSDGYEHLHRKLFYAFMLFDLLTAPEMVVKIDDNIALEDPVKFQATLDRVTQEQAAYAGRAVGTSRHHEQWHGWHLGKCADPLLETRGYQFPLPRAYASGGYGYVLGRVGLSACSYMYLTMKEFFNMRAVGLEDACVGHAMFAQQIDIMDLSREPEGASPVFLAMPGLATKECLQLERELADSQSA